MIRIENEKRGIQDAVFIAFYSKYILTNAYKEEGKEITVTLMNLRWDGSFGFIGGFVDEGEILKEALVREVKEEVNYDLNLDKVKHVVSHSLGDKNIHLYKIEITFDEIKDLIRNSVDSQDFCNEVGGLSLVHLFDYGVKGFSNFLRNNFIEGAREELLIFANQENKEINIEDKLLPNEINIYEEIPSISNLLIELKEMFPNYSFEEKIFGQKNDGFKVSKYGDLDLFYSIVYLLKEDNSYIFENDYDAWRLFTKEEVFEKLENL